MNKKLYNEIGEWSKEVLPKADSINHLEKLKHEAQEAIEEPKDVYEYADCYIALTGAAYKAGIDFTEMIKALEKKLEIIKVREWELLPDGTYQHIKK